MIFVLLVLFVEAVGARHGHDPHPSRQAFRGLRGKLDLGPRGNDDRIGGPVRVPENIRSPMDVFDLVRRSDLVGYPLTGQQQRCRSLCTFDSHFPGDRALDAITGTP